MIGKLKRLALVLAALLAIGAVGAAGASAQGGVLTSDGPVTLTGTEAEGDNKLEAFGGSVECETTYTGHKALNHQQTTELGENDKPLLESGATEVTVVPEYAKCEQNGGGGVTVYTLGCDFELYDPTTISTGTYSLTVDLVCPEGKDIVITTSPCNLTIPPQTELPGLQMTNSEGQLEITGTLEGITAWACYPVLHTSEASLDLDLSFVSEDEEGKPAEVSVSDQTPPENPGEITSDGPVTLAGAEVDRELNTMHWFGSTLRCDSIYTGHRYAETPHALLPSGEGTITITPHYANCEEERAFDMNGCDFVLHVGEKTGEEGAYGVTTDIVCPEGKSILLTAPSGPCDLTIPPQTGLSGPHLTNAASSEGMPEDIQMEGTFGGIKAVACETLPTAEGTLVTDLTFKAEDESGEPTGISISD